MLFEEFEKSLKEDDFAVGDSFWINNWEFEVVNKMGKSFIKDEPVFKWELTKNEFIQVIKDNYPKIKNPEKFFSKHEDDIVEYFEKGFDVLISDCGATYGSVMNDAVDEVYNQLKRGNKK